MCGIGKLAKYDAVYREGTAGRPSIFLDPLTEELSPLERKERKYVLAEAIVGNLGKMRISRQIRISLGPVILLSQKVAGHLC
jgi:hypothetical protein